MVRFNPSGLESERNGPMVQQDETTHQALAYIRHQASKGLAGLRVLAERTAADCGRCLEGMSEEQARFKPGDEWSAKEVLDHLIYSTARAVIEPIRDLGCGKVPRPFTPDDSGGGGVGGPPRAGKEDGGRFLRGGRVCGGSPGGGEPRRPRGGTL